MKKFALGLIIALGLITSYRLNAFADGVTVTFGTDGKLLSTGTLNANAAPGETVERTVTLKNDNNKTVDFYLGTEVLTALEEINQNAKGAGYDLSIKVGDKTLYDSTLGGYSEEGVANSLGLKDVNEIIKGNVPVATLAKGKTETVTIKVSLDGEGMDNVSDTVNYADAIATLQYEFKAGYDDPTGIFKEKKIVEQKEEKKTVTIYKERVPLSPKTGGNVIPFAGILLLAVGTLLIVLGSRRVKKDEN